ncbi:MAG: response regulator transcription factor [Chloroflexi bacterium]|nr:response regulator transcription factor [Chloroflexota bacterium]
MMRSGAWGGQQAFAEKHTTDPARQGNESHLSVLHINGGILVRTRQSDNVPMAAQPITEREREVLALVAEGNSNKLIANRLGISERTVKNHLTYIMTKLGAADRTHAVVTAVRLGWLAI